MKRSYTGSLLRHHNSLFVVIPHGAQKNGARLPAPIMKNKVNLATANPPKAYVRIVAAVAAFSGLLFGFDTAVINGASGDPGLDRAVPWSRRAERCFPKHDVDQVSGEYSPMRHSPEDRHALAEQTEQ